MAKLTFVLEDGQEVVVPLTERITIGRADDNDVVVDDERIALQHAELLQNADGSIQVFDLKSDTGTFVNGERQMSCTLLDGDKLSFGPLIALLDLELPDAAMPPNAAPTESTPAAPAPDDTHAEATTQLEAEKARLKAEVDAVEKELRDWEQRAEKERAMHNARVESLRAEQEQLAPLQAAVEEARAAHHDWLEAIATLSSQHEEKTTALERLNTQHFEKSTEVQRLTAAAAAAQEQVDALAARLKQVRDECEQDEALLSTLRQQVIEMEARLKEGQELAAARIEQVQTTEKKIAQLEQLAQHLEKVEAHIEELRGSEERLEQAHSRCQEAEKQHATLTATLETLANEQQRAGTTVKELSDRLATLQQSATAAEASLVRTQTDLAAETRRLEETQARRAEIEQQCQELAATKQQLADAKQRLTAVEQRYREVQANHTEGGQQLAERKTTQREESKPAAAADTTQQAELTRQIEIAKRELAELEANTAGLRDLQAATDQRHAVLPPDVSAAHAPVSSTANELATAPIPALRIVHVDAVRLSPIPMKSERTRVQSADTAPPSPKPKPKSKKS